MLKRDIAIELAEYGMFVFPLKEGGKTPAFKGWQESATRDPAKITKLWANSFSDEPRNLNIGIATGPSGLLVIDVDVKDDRRGDLALDQVVQAHSALPATLRVHTPSGGIHYYFKAAPMRNSVNRIGQGIDTRSDGGFVVGPGSETDKGIYEIMED